MTAPFDDHQLAELRRVLGAMEARAPEAPDLRAISERPHPATKPVLSRRPIVVVAGAAVLTLALLLPVGLWLRGGGGSPDESSSSLGTVSSSSVTEGTDATTTAPPQSTTTSPEVTTTVGSSFQITTVPERVSTEGLEVRINRPQMSHFDRPDSQTRINNQLDAFVDGRRTTYLPNPDSAGEPAVYGLDFEVLWLEEDAWPVLSVVFTETAMPAGAAEATVQKFALMFDLVTGDPLTAADMLTPEGVASLESMVPQRLADVFDGPVCCFEPGELVENVGVGPDGLVAYVNVSFPRGAGPLEFLFTWAEVADLIDMRERFLAPRVVEYGGCSVQGEGLVLEEQAGLPEPVAAKRRAIFEAAVACDFEALGALVPLDESDSLWGFQAVMGGSAEAWRDYEGHGYAPLWFLVRTLSLSYGPETFAYGQDQDLQWRGHVWPAAASAQPGEWSSLPADQRAELADLYGDEAVASFAEHGSFSSYRVLIRDDGTWWYFGVQGD